MWKYENCTRDCIVFLLTMCLILWVNLQASDAFYLIRTNFQTCLLNSNPVWNLLKWLLSKEDALFLFNSVQEQGTDINSTVINSQKVDILLSWRVVGNSPHILLYCCSEMFNLSYHAFVYATDLFFANACRIRQRCKRNCSGSFMAPDIMFSNDCSND